MESDLTCFSHADGPAKARRMLGQLLWSKKMRTSSANPTHVYAPGPNLFTDDLSDSTASRTTRSHDQCNNRWISDSREHCSVARCLESYTLRAIPVAHVEEALWQCLTMNYRYRRREIPWLQVVRFHKEIVKRDEESFSHSPAETISRTLDKPCGIRAGWFCRSLR